MKLKSLQVFPNGTNGWETDVFTFGDHITQLLGPNGCGKTPIIQSIAFCLGYPNVFRNDIYEQCNHAILKIETQDGIYKLKRVYAKSVVDIEVTSPDGSNERFFNEADYSKFIFELLRLEVINLMTNRNTVTSPYLATLLPFFYIDQDDGYADIYCPPSKFIKDQFSEMMRILFDLPIKNSFDAKKDRIEAKRNLDFLDRLVDEQAKQINLAEGSIAAINRSEYELATEISKLEVELEDLKDQGASKDDSVSSLDRLIASHNNLLHDIDFELKELFKMRESVAKIITEINTEINTLNLNEEARRIFLSFNEICGSDRCQLFSASSDSYGKNLLYLKDQLKDLKRNDQSDQTMIERLNREKNKYQELIQTLVDERNATLDQSDISSIVNATSELKNEIFRLQSDLKELEKYELLKKKYADTVIDRNKALDHYESFSSSGSSNPDLLRIRAELRQLFLNWMDALHTRNVSRDVTFKDDFVPVLGVENIRQLKGSTKIRTILAFHASILELTALHGSKFNFLILDTPKQHEIHNEDLDRYFCALKEICKNHELQIIFSTTEYEYERDAKDSLWIPPYPGKEQSMFMRKAGIS